MIVKTLIIVVGLFLLLFLESFFTALFSFCVLILVLLILIDKWDWKSWSFFAVISTLITDTLLHRPFGVTLFAVAISLATLYLLFLVMPKKQIILSYIPYFFAIFLFYLLLNLLTPLLQDGVWGVVNWLDIFGYTIRAIISVLIIFLSNRVIENFRSNEDILV
ncbi:MAG: hypothetical protein PHG60_00825 [Candidatus Dojkabacteria bacterium]|nr:hypothetical protein [Candidatus Dojkabacteria bacterium]